MSEIPLWWCWLVRSKKSYTGSKQSPNRVLLRRCRRPAEREKRLHSRVALQAPIQWAMSGDMTKKRGWSNVLLGSDLRPGRRSTKTDYKPRARNLLPNASTTLSLCKSTQALGKATCGLGGGTLSLARALSLSLSLSLCRSLSLSRALSLSLSVCKATCGLGGGDAFGAWCSGSPPWSRVQGKSQVNLPQMPLLRADICMGVD